MELAGFERGRSRPLRFLERGGEKRSPGSVGAGLAVWEDRAEGREREREAEVGAC